MQDDIQVARIAEVLRQHKDQRSEFRTVVVPGSIQLEYKCSCGEWYTALNYENHAAEKIQEMLNFCNSCDGPFDGWLMEQYDGHWDSCPNRPFK